MTETIPKTGPSRVRPLLGLALGIGALTWFLQGMDRAALGTALSTVRMEWVVVSALILLSEFGLRAWRWRVLLAPLGGHVRLSDLFAAQVIGAAANTLLPLRAGEVAKPLVATRRTGLPLASVVATSVMERVYDLLGLLFVLLLMVIMLPPAGPEGELVHNLKLYGAIFGGVGVAAMATFFFLAGNRARPIFARIARLGPPPLRDQVLVLFDGFIAGLGNTRDPRGRTKAAAISLVLWLNGALAIYVLFHAFGLELPFAAACFVGVAIALTVALPQAPGFVGVFHLAMEKTIMLWTGSEGMLAEAQGFAIVFWAISFLPVTLLGVIAAWKEGTSLSGLRGDDTP